MYENKEKNSIDLKVRFFLNYYSFSIKYRWGHRAGH
jgi:hypothetical protein